MVAHIMANTFFQFKQFIIHQEQCAMKVTTDACLFGAWVAERVRSRKPGNGVSAKISVLDIGTGTGLLSLMLAQKNPSCFIDAVEMDEAAAGQAAENIAASPWADRIRVIQADVMKHTFSSTYDIIISNPPFYERELKSVSNRANMARHDEGLVLPELLTFIQQRLKPGGVFYLLLPFKRQQEFLQLLFKKELCILNTMLVRQSEKHDCFRIMTEGQHAGMIVSEPVMDAMCFRQKNNHYTTSFKDLLSEYYLHL